MYLHPYSLVCWLPCSRSPHLTNKSTHSNKFIVISSASSLAFNTIFTTSSLLILAIHVLQSCLELMLVHLSYLLLSQLYTINIETKSNNNKQGSQTCWFEYIYTPNIFSRKALLWFHMWFFIKTSIICKTTLNHRLDKGNVKLHYVKLSRAWTPKEMIQVEIKSEWHLVMTCHGVYMHNWDLHVFWDLQCRKEAQVLFSFLG